MADDSSQCGGSSPVPRSIHTRRFESSRLFLTEGISKAMLDDESMEEKMEFGSNFKPTCGNFFDTKLKLRNARLSTIASSSSMNDYPSLIRESRSLELFPYDMYSKRFVCENSPSIWTEPKKIFRSLEDCVKFTQANPKMHISEKALDNNHPNGDVIMLAHGGKSPNEAEIPLLLGNDDDECMGDTHSIKHSYSLDQEKSGPSTDDVPDNKVAPSNSLKSWFSNLLNGTGLHKNESYLTKMDKAYSIKTERESIV